MTPTSFVVSWPAETVGTAPFVYITEHRVSGTPVWTDNPLGVTTNLSQPITGLTPGTTYEVRVKVINAVGSNFSPSVIQATPTTSSTESVEGTLAPPSPSLTNGDGAIFTITAGKQVAVNGVIDGTTSNLIELYYHNHAVYREETNGNSLGVIPGWWFKVHASDAWTPTQNPVGQPTPTESAEGTAVPPAASITDIDGDAFTLLSSTVRVNGANDTFNAGTITSLYYHNHAVYQQSTATSSLGDHWWFKAHAGNAWVATTSPIASPKSVSVSTIASQVAGVAFTVSGTLTGYSSAPTLEYQDNQTGSWLPLPSGSTVTTTTFSFTHPAMTASGSTSAGSAGGRALAIAQGTTTGVAPSLVTTFLSSLGVNTHIDQGFSPSSYVTPLQFTGIHAIRTGFSNISGAVTVHNSTGVLVNVFGSSDLTSHLAAARTLATAGALLSLEGPNEPNNFPFSYLGNTGGGSGTWVPVAQYQRDLYAGVKADGQLQNFPVFHVSEGGGEVDNVGMQFLTIPAGANIAMPDGTQYADYANPHNYVSGNLGGQYVNNTAWNAADPVLNSSWDGLFVEYGTTWHGGFAGYNSTQLQTLPRVTSETGWDSTLLGETVQGKVLLNTYLAQFKRGWRYTFIYEMFDQEASSGNQGLYRSDKVTTKLAATYIHNMTTILAGGANIAATSFSYTIASQPSTVHDLLLQKTANVYDLVVWGEQVSGSNNITVNLTTSRPSVKVFDPTVGTTAVQTLTNVSSVALAVSDHPFIIEVNTTSSGSVPLGLYAGVPGDAASGGYPGFNAQWDGFTSSMGRAATLCLSYMNSDRSPTDGTFGWAAQASFYSGQLHGNARTVNAIPIISWPFGYDSGSGNTDVAAAIAAGTHDALIQTCLGNWKANGYSTLYIRPGWEFNLPNQWAVPTVTTLANYIAAFQHLYTAVHNYATSNGMTIKVVWNPNVGNNQNNPTLTVAQQYPGNAFVDVLGIDTYGSPVDGGHSPTATTTDATQYLVSTMFDMAVSNNKPVAFGEVGGIDTTFATQMGNALTSRASSISIEFFALWDIDDSSGNLSWTNASDNQTTLANTWKSFLGSGGTVRA